MHQKGSRPHAPDDQGIGPLPNLDVIVDRSLFLNALQAQVPEFFRGFQKSLDHLPGDTHESAIEVWAESFGIVDAWLIRVLKDTDSDWQAKPEGARAQFRDKSEWFVYKERDQAIPPFNPRFENAWPNVNAETRGVETVEAFSSRMTEQFKSQLKDYSNMMRHLSREGERAERRKHAIWTVLVFTGRTVQEIVQAEELARKLRAKTQRVPLSQGDLESTIKKAVQRFAQDIGLTVTVRLG
jgi:hypothetical protein